MSLSKIILTDSGGIQEEVFSLNVPTLVMRNNTERYEGISNSKSKGLVKLVGTKSEDIIEEVLNIFDDENQYKKENVNPYGDGKSSKRIVKIIAKTFELES
tara:strand:- start:1041 stop:1343 length:303 start_codon:yes stop_codon:yes gene_type:complete